MTDSDLTLKVLVEMRDEMRGLRTDFNGLRTDFNERLKTLEHHAAETNRQAAQTNQRLEVIEHTMVDFGTQVVLLGRDMKNSVTRHDSDVERHDDEIADLRTRVEKLETKS
ncbi:MAG TPA: hypothetical protein VIV58_26675 [Kofleriaceae bacterium]